MNKVIYTCVIYQIGTIVSIHTIMIPDVSGNNIDFNSYRNKKILIVNVASNSDKVSQLAELQQLYLQHMDSMIIVAFPSNSFGNEPKTNSEIKLFMQQSYSITFPVASKSYVTGDSSNYVHKWIANKMLNDVMSSKVIGDYQKYLVNKKGKIIAVFDGSISPLDSTVQKAIHSN